MTTREFHLGDILTVTTGRLVSPRHMDGVYDILNYMTGDSLFTHQLPRASEECEPHLLAQYPDLRQVEVPDEFDSKDHVESWLAAQVAIFGEYRPVSPLADADHTRIDPVDELRMMRPDLPVVGVVVEEDGRDSQRS